MTHTELATAPGHPFYMRLNELLDQEKFDEFAESECAGFYADNNGRPSLPPGSYFRLLLIGYFEGIDSERGIAWRVADSLGLRQFLRIGLDEDTPDHSTISRTRRLIDVETHGKVFLWVLGVIGKMMSSLQTKAILPNFRPSAHFASQTSSRREHCVDAVLRPSEVMIGPSAVFTRRGRATA